jgi:hypothetical protein
MPVTLDPERLRHVPSPVIEKPDPEALIEEAWRRQRKRRLVLALLATVAAATGIAAYLVNDGPNSNVRRYSRSSARGAAVARPLTVQLRLRGWGAPQPSPIGSGPCPAGRTYVVVASVGGKAIGSENECMLAVSKTDVPGYGVRSTHATLIATYRLPNGTLVTRETRTFLFARDQLHTQGTFHGKILRGTERYAGAQGTLTGGGPGVGSTAIWRVALHVRLR